MGNETTKGVASDPAFYANKVFPELEALLAFKLKPLKEVKDGCVVVLDTNTLLVPYTVGKASLTAIRKTYEDLIKADRLVVPGQVVREYARNRIGKLAELHGQIARKKSTVQDIEADNYPLLQSMQKYVELLALREAVNREIRKYRELVDAILADIRGWSDDPVRAMYAELFKGAVIQEVDVNDNAIAAEVLEDWKWRGQHRIPPGFEDKGRIGDLLIWRTILEVVARKKVSVLFVSQEFSKEDWRHAAEARKETKVPFHPRVELVDEFRRVSGGQSFHMVQLHELLELYGASAAVVEDVRLEQEKVSIRTADEIRGWTWAKIAQEAARVIEDLKQFLIDLDKQRPAFGSPGNRIWTAGTAASYNRRIAERLLAEARLREDSDEIVHMLPPWEPISKQYETAKYLMALRDVSAYFPPLPGPELS